MKVHFLDLASILVLFSTSTWKKSSQPNILEMNYLPFYASMPPLECHHPKDLKVCFLLNK
jgi:hypothetical protein